jgi:Flp pilus assembly protein TadD
VREDADAAFPRYRAEAEADPESWQAWMRLGIVYDACGDRRRARGAIRQAISLERDEIRGASAQS